MVWFYRLQNSDQSFLSSTTSNFAFHESSCHVFKIQFDWIEFQGFYNNLLFRTDVLDLSVHSSMDCKPRDCDCHILGGGETSDAYSEEEEEEEVESEESEESSEEEDDDEDSGSRKSRRRRRRGKR